jgi:hypothetical protein
MGRRKRRTFTKEFKTKVALSINNKWLDLRVVLQKVAILKIFIVRQAFPSLTRGARKGARMSLML